MSQPSHGEEAKDPTLFRLLTEKPSQPAPSRQIARASAVARQVSELVSGERERTHGDKVENHQNIADLWNAFLGKRLLKPLSPREVALLMALLKVARTKSGAYNPDDYVDLTGYGAVAAEIASLER